MLNLKEKPRLRRSITITIIVGMLIAIGLWIKRIFAKKQPEEFTSSAFYQHGITGLNLAEVEARQTNARAEARLLAEKQIQKDQIKRRLFSIFNVTLLVMFITQLFMKNYWGALGTLGALILNIAISAFNQIRSARQVGKLLSAARPKATAIREGELNSIDQDAIVIGDVLIVGKGDEIFADGIILASSQMNIDSTPYDLSPTIEEKSKDDLISAGSFCESGWAIYQVESIREEVEVDQISSAATPISEVKTPLQKGIRTMLLTLLIIAGIFYVILIIELLRLDYFPSELILIYQQAISIIFSIAPAGLLFMVIINYAIGSANIAKAGALIRNSQTIEALAQVTSLLLVRKKNLNSLSLQIDMIANAAGDFLFSETRTRQLLGNYVYSVPALQFPFSIIKEELEGSRYQVKQEARFFSVLGWEAINFNSEDMPGTYVIGYPEYLEAYLEHPPELVNNESQPKDQSEERLGITARFVNMWEKVKPKKPPHEAGSEIEEHESTGESDLTKVSRWHRLKSRLKLRSIDRQELPGQNTSEAEDDEVMRLLFAYAPGSLTTGGSSSRPPSGLKPICLVNIIKTHRLDVKDAMDAVQQMGITRKILSSGHLHDVDGLAKELACKENAELAAHIISGEELSEKLALGEESVILDKSVFYQHTTEQMAQVIDLLRDEGQFVAIKTSTDAEIPLMSHADINVTSQGSSHKLITKADVVLMDNSPGTLPNVLQMGQNILQSVINLLKLNLTEIGYVLLLIFGMFLTGNRRFVYEPIQGAVIGIVTITLPSVFISFWTNSLNAKQQNIRKQLSLFIIPAMLTIAIVVLGTFLLFNWRGYAFIRIQHVITHLLILIGLLLVVFCYPPISLLSCDGQYSSDWRLTKVSIVLFVLVHALTFLPLFQKHLRVYPLPSGNDYLLVWAIGLGWGMVTLALWRISWMRMRKNEVRQKNLA